jgi:predicted esterase
MTQVAIAAACAWICSAAAPLEAGDPPAPPLPSTDRGIDLPAQEIPGGGPRTIHVEIRYPGHFLKSVKPTTGVMLLLHNWGGTGFGGSPMPRPEDLDVIEIGVDYYQSGDTDKSVPYDFGYYQAMDALRALAWVKGGLAAAGVAYDKSRTYGAGGSGGGNVIQMSNKFAPRTFACIVDCSGMASLNDDIAFNLPGASGLDARWSKDPASPSFLSPAMQQIRDLGNPAHLALSAQRGNKCRVVVIHGVDDGSCPASDKKRAVEAMQAAGLDVEPHLIGKEDVDGKAVANTGHSIGNRTDLLLHFARAWLAADSDKACRLTGPDDFERKEDLPFPVEGGTVIVSYAKGWPEIRFDPTPKPSTPTMP